MRKEYTFNQGLDKNLICRSLEFFALQKIGMTVLNGIIGRSLDLACQLGAMTSLNGMTGEKCIRKRGMTNKKGCQLGGMTLFVYCLLSGVAHAECVPTPDCASIGYTETSCETSSLACPFNSTKLKCLPCDSTFRYSCSGDNITGGVGSSCNGKYVSCECFKGATFNNGECICDTSCKVGAIYYSDGSCSSCVDSSKTAIGIVVKDNKLVLTPRSSSTMKWSTDYVGTSLTNYENSTDAKEDLNGKSNTAIILAEDTGAVAAKYCNDYTTAGTSAGDWYLPAAGELYSYVYGNYSAINTAMTSLGWALSATHWSSSERDHNYAWRVSPSTGGLGSISGNGKKDSLYVSCLLAIN